MIFSRAFSYLEESRFSPSSVVDLGAGLGFLTHLVLSRFPPRARATLVDTFSGHGLRGASVDRARANMEALGYAQRVDFYVADVRSLPFSDASFDMAVTSLVFHNLSDGGSEGFLGDAEGCEAPPGLHAVRRHIHRTGEAQGLPQRLQGDAEV
ncbi:class I SAM-dependent methyltransferase [Thermogymnomonas acidicola]|uniref:class I SAM-dependent methyltransferase n=1 Tax=Thermogymnomonas acidicola TaxID=399579 RepID=UPI0009462EBA|nr:class I SAM-dependent methyltransferase [Thermogymnomonas acidicola]